MNEPESASAVVNSCSALVHEEIDENREAIDEGTYDTFEDCHDSLIGAVCMRDVVGPNELRRLCTRAEVSLSLLAIKTLGEEQTEYAADLIVKRLEQSGYRFTRAQDNTAQLLAEFEECSSRLLTKVTLELFVEVVAVLVKLSYAVGKL